MAKELRKPARASKPENIEDSESLKHGGARGLRGEPGGTGGEEQTDCKLNDIWEVRNSLKGSDWTLNWEGR